MSPSVRIANRYVFESRVLIRFRRGSRNYAAHGWARDLSETGLSAFVGESLLPEEAVTLEIPLAEKGKLLFQPKLRAN
jgi:hypothetical protein